MAGTHLSIRIDLPSGDRIGPGKIALLEAIRSTGSISAAARSHRHVVPAGLALGRRDQSDAARTRGHRRNRRRRAAAARW